TRVAKAGDTMTGGLSFGSVLQTNPRDISRHLALWGGGTSGFGLSMSANSLNIVAGNAAANVVSFYTSTTGGPHLQVRPAGILVPGENTGYRLVDDNCPSLRYQAGFLYLQQGSNNTQPRIRNFDGSNARDILDTNNFNTHGDARYVAKA